MTGLARWNLHTVEADLLPFVLLVSLAVSPSVSQIFLEVQVGKRQVGFLIPILSDWDHED